MEVPIAKAKKQANQKTTPRRLCSTRHIHQKLRDLERTFYETLFNQKGKEPSTVKGLKNSNLNRKDVLRIQIYIFPRKELFGYSTDKKP